MNVKNYRYLSKYLLTAESQSNLADFVEETLKTINTPPKIKPALYRPSYWSEDGLTFLFGANGIEHKFYTFDELSGYAIAEMINITTIRDVSIYLVPTVNITQTPYKDNPNIGLVKANEFDKMSAVDKNGSVPKRIHDWFEQHTKLVDDYEKAMKKIESYPDVVVNEDVDYSDFNQYLSDTGKQKLRILVGVVTGIANGDKIEILVGATSKKPRFKSMKDMADYFCAREVMIDNVKELSLYVVPSTTVKEFRHSTDSFKTYSLNGYEFSELSLTEGGVNPTLTTWFRKCANDVLESKASYSSTLENFEDEPSEDNDLKSEEYTNVSFEDVNAPHIPSISYNHAVEDKPNTTTKQFFQTEDKSIVIHAGTTLGLDQYLVLKGEKAGQVITGIKLLPVDEATVFYTLTELLN